MGRSILEAGVARVGDGVKTLDFVGLRHVEHIVMPFHVVGLVQPVEHHFDPIGQAVIIAIRQTHHLPGAHQGHIQLSIWANLHQARRSWNAGKDANGETGRQADPAGSAVRGGQWQLRGGFGNQGQEGLWGQHTRHHTRDDHGQADEQQAEQNACPTIA